MTLILAKFLGIFMVVFGLSILMKREGCKDVVADLIEHKASQLIAGLMPLVIGAYIVVIHNIWVGSWEVLITILGWLMLLAGIVRLILTDFWIEKLKAYKDKMPYTIMGIVIFVVGLVLLYFGFMA